MITKALRTGKIALTTSVLRNNAPVKQEDTLFIGRGTVGDSVAISTTGNRAKFDAFMKTKEVQDWLSEFKVEGSDTSPFFREDV